MNGYSPLGGKGNPKQALEGTRNADHQTSLTGHRSTAVARDAESNRCETWQDACATGQRCGSNALSCCLQMLYDSYDSYDLVEAEGLFSQPEIQRPKSATSPSRCPAKS